VRRPKYSLDAKRNFAAAMRVNPTGGEAAMWELLRGESTGYRFRRQITVMGFILDFWCPSLRIAIEVDGSAHLNEDIAARDVIKEKALEGAGIKLLRFDNDDVLHFRTPVCMRIQAECDKRGRFRGAGKGYSGDNKNLPSRSSSREENPSTTLSKKPNYKIVRELDTNNGAQNLCTTASDVVQISSDHLITPAEYEKFMAKLVTLRRQRSMDFDNRSVAEKAADLRYRFDEHMTRKARRG
jgi:very-short-patch-repair endonuclease